MPYPHDESHRQRHEVDDDGLRPQNTPRYPHADAPELATESRPESTDRTDTGVGDRDGATRAGTPDGKADDAGGTG